MNKKGAGCRYMGSDIITPDVPCHHVLLAVLDTSQGTAEYWNETNRQSSPVRGGCMVDSSHTALRKQFSLVFLASQYLPHEALLAVGPTPECGLMCLLKARDRRVGKISTQNSKHQLRISIRSHSNNVTTTI